MQCSVCGAAADAGDRFCRVCGRRFQAAPRVSGAVAPPPGASEKEPERQKRFALRLKMLSIAIITLALLMAVLAQVAPDLFQLTGSNPVDLGVSWTETDYQNAVKKCGVLCDDPPAGADRSKYEVTYSGSQDIDWNLTESEVTALLNGGGQPGYWPASRIQAKIHGDNVLEVSCMLDPKKFVTYPVISRNLPKEALDYVAGISFELPVHATVQVRFAGPKQANATVKSLSVAGISMAGTGTDEQANRMLEGILNEMLQEAGPVHITSFTTGEGSMRLAGSWYRQMQREKLK